MSAAMRGPRRETSGFTLVELLVALLTFSLVVVAILTLWLHAQTSYFVGSESAEIQGDARVAVDQMSRDLMKAGRDVLQCAFDSQAYTQCSGSKLARCRALLSDPSFSCSGVMIIPAASSTSVKVQMDLDGDGHIDTSPPSEESITYAFDAPNHRITRQQGTGTARTLADNIQSLTLTYEGRVPSGTGVCTGAWGVLTNVAADQTQRDCIQRVTITLVAQGSVVGVGGVGRDPVQRTIRTTVDLRTR